MHNDSSVASRHRSAIKAMILLLLPLFRLLKGEQASAAAPDPIAGINTPGTNVYPQPGLIRLGSAVFNGETSLSCVVTDPAGAFAYFGTNSTPGQIVKVYLATLARVGAIELPEGESGLQCAVIDPTGAFAYFGTNGTPGSTPDSFPLLFQSASV